MANETKIDTLSIDIDYSAGSASSGIDSLTQALGKLSGITGTSISNLKSISKQLTNFAQSSNALQGVDFSSFSNSMQAISSAVQPLTELQKTNLGSFVNQLKKIPELNKSLDSKTIAAFTDKIKQLSNAMIPLANNLQKVGSVLNNMPSKLNKVSNYANKTTKTMSSLSSLSKLLNFAAVTALASRVGKYLGEFISQSNKYVEDLNLFNVAMGESTEKAKEWIDTVSDVLGLDPANMMRYMGVFQMIANGFGLTAENAYKMSKNLTQLTYDREMSCYIVIYNKKRGEPVNAGCEQYLIAC